jgi:DNA-binding CsgD family transcriptional regulator
MRNNAAQSRKGLASSPAFPHPSAEELVRVLVHHAAKNNGFNSDREPKDGAEEIVIDTEVDGVRYLLVRLPTLTHGHVSLSPREQEIVRMVAQGHPNKVIADVLSISSWTVCTHLRRIFAKLGVGSRAAMVARHLELGRGGLRAGCREPHSGLSPTSTAHPAQLPGNSRTQPVRPSLTIPARNYSEKG